MADALITPAVGGTLWAASAAISLYSVRQVKRTLRDQLIPMMGVLGAFTFTAQMFNIAIPGTGSSGHLIGTLMLAILLGPHAAFLIIASVLTVQALFFADGGLLALGCNIFNLGFFPAFVAYPLVYRAIAGENPAATRASAAAIVAAVVGLQLGALSVALETCASGIAGLSFRTFVLLLLPIHLVIGVVEGLATAAVVRFVARERPDILAASAGIAGKPPYSRAIFLGLVVAAVALGSAARWFGSPLPDGLEWSIAKAATAPAQGAVPSASGLLGGALVLLLAGLLGFAIKAQRSPSAGSTPRRST